MAKNSPKKAAPKQPENGGQPTNKSLPSFVVFLIIFGCIVVAVLAAIAVVIFRQDTANVEYPGMTQVVSVAEDFEKDFLGSSEGVVLKERSHYDEYVYDPLPSSVDFDKYDYVLTRLLVNDCSETIKGVDDVEISKSYITITFRVETRCGFCAQHSEYFLVPVEKGKISKGMVISYNYNFDREGAACDPMVEDKPMIYIYPEAATDVNVTLGNPDKLTATYPKYNNGWTVHAEPDGTLTDPKTGRSFYGLYWQGRVDDNRGIRDEGFVVAGEDSASFLEEKLAILGLNEREANEFIVYWLPKLEANKYNFIYFETAEEIEKYMPLSVSPAPDTTIRLMMDFKGLSEPIKVKEQTLEKVNRKGYTVVEWGGTELK